MKFKYLKIDLESKTTYNCHAAAPHPVDFAWLDKNPGQLFNTDVNVAERGMMLRNERNTSCEQNCWVAEDAGAVSPRLYQGGVEQTHTEPITRPEIIDLTINGDCNLTCTYCCKEFSSAWRRDVVNNGDYNTVNTDDRYKANVKDRALLKISQSTLKTTAHYQTLFNEIKLSAPGLKKLTVTGGEPLLDNSLVNMLKSIDFAADTVVEIYTGLGVAMPRFVRFIEELKTIPNLLLLISAEATEKFLEFNRYGVKWPDFVRKVEILKETGINFKFHATVTNLTIFDFANFVDYFKPKDMNLTFAYQPRMMAPYVLDKTSKESIIQSISGLSTDFKKQIMESMQNDPTEEDRKNIGIFLQEFVARRSDLDLNIYPQSFLNWIKS